MRLHLPSESNNLMESRVILNLEFPHEGALDLVQLATYLNLLCSNYEAIAHLDLKDSPCEDLLRHPHGWISLSEKQACREHLIELIRRRSLHQFFFRNLLRVFHINPRTPIVVAPILVESINFNSPLKIRLRGALIPLLLVMVLSEGVTEPVRTNVNVQDANVQEFNVQLPPIKTAITNLRETEPPSESEKK